MQQCNLQYAVAYLTYSCPMGFPDGTRGKEPACQCRGLKEMWVWVMGREDPLKEGMATHSSIHPRRIPLTEKPGGLWSMGLQRVGHKLKQLRTHTHTHRVPQ